MKALAVFTLCLLSSPAYAVDHRWTQGFGQGTLESIIENAGNSSVNIYCPAGQEDHTPGMFIESSKVKPALHEQVTVHVIVDGKIHPFDLQETQFLAGSPTGLKNLQVLVAALAKSRSGSFTVEFPKYKVVETFSLLDARKSLGTGKDSVLSGCDE